jgi:hypothetical protein
VLAVRKDTIQHCTRLSENNTSNFRYGGTVVFAHNPQCWIEMKTPEEEAREQIDRMLDEAGWAVQDLAQANVRASEGVAIREFPLRTGYGQADYLLYVESKAVGAIELESSIGLLQRSRSSSRGWIWRWRR